MVKATWCWLRDAGSTGQDLVAGAGQPGRVRRIPTLWLPVRSTWLRVRG
jgi:hypothetical protein